MNAGASTKGRIMGYHVRAGARGKRVVEFSCPHCQAPLQSPLEEAGQRFACPNCGGEFLTPGHTELRQWQEQLAAMDAMKGPSETDAEAEAEKRELEAWHTAAIGNMPQAVQDGAAE